MAGIEGITGAGMAYQGSVSTPQVKAETQVKVEAASNEATGNQIAQNTMSISTNNISEDGNGSQSNNQGNQSNAQQTEKIKKAVEDINRKAVNSEAVFGIHEGTNRVTIKIVDKKTKEIIKEFPPEKTLDMIAKAWEMAGLMVDEKR